ncbi:Osmotically-inducible protein Y precursor [Marinomonas spartinae]|uniref:Osmotically-inducible protein Y n=1 Tax=Marinomonas spartinae TaxID=1792290 RepID=A0A1A8T6J3_9GAMM|nr:BON domain-containing protein [Marinomonas spartinae]SBS26715.1 Osmotically-inducible protein Y precursor [Marinomonas spartinae]
MKNTIMSILFVSALTAGAAHAQTNDHWTDRAKDAWIDGKAEATLLFNQHVNAFHIKTSVKDGVVTLTGTTDNSTDKDLAGELVQGLQGVKEVKNNITIADTPANSPKGADKSDMTDQAKSTLIDTKIATVLKTRYLWNQNIEGTKIHIDVDKGIVTLTGDVKSDAEKQLAVQIARNTTDVKQVKDELKVATIAAQ